MLDTHKAYTNNFLSPGTFNSLAINIGLERARRVIQSALLRLLAIESTPLPSTDASGAVSNLMRHGLVEHKDGRDDSIPVSVVFWSGTVHGQYGTASAASCRGVPPSTPGLSWTGIHLVYSAVMKSKRIARVRV